MLVDGIVASSLTPFGPSGELRLDLLQWRALAPLMRLIFREHLGGGEDPNWLSIMKAALNMIGPPVGDPLAPIQPLDAQNKRVLATILRDLGYQVHEQANEQAHEVRRGRAPHVRHGESGAPDGQR